MRVEITVDVQGDRYMVSLEGGDNIGWNSTFVDPAAIDSTLYEAVGRIQRAYKKGEK